MIFTDFFRVGFGKGTAEDREVLRENENQAAVDPAIAGDEAIAVDTSAPPSRNRAQRCATSLSVSSKRAFVEQKLNAFARRHLAFFMLLLAAPDPAAFLGQMIALFEFFQLLFEIHGPQIIGELLRRDGNAQTSDPASGGGGLESQHDPPRARL